MEPFYMTFPMQNLFLAELEYEKDFERMKEMYPKETARIAALISDRCDELEFEGSRIYDENPDRMMMAREAQSLYEKIKKELGMEAEMETEMEAEMEAEMESEGTDEPERVVAFSLLPPSDWALPQQMPPVLPQQPQLQSPQSVPPMQPQLPPPVQLQPPQSPPLPGQPPMEGCNDWLCSVVNILLSNEIYKRRCRYRRSQRWW